MKRTITLLLGALSLAFLNIPSASANLTILDKNGWKFFTTGFVETDAIMDSTRSLTEVVGNNPIDRPGSFNGDNGRTQFSVRNSRLGFGLLPPAQNGWSTKGYLEFDLLGYDPAPGSPAGNSESSFFVNPTLRLRHAFLSADKDGWHFLVGQTWTLFAWQPDYILTTASLPPVSGTDYERTPQILAEKTIAMGELNAFQAALAVNRPVQRDSTYPDIQAGARLMLGGRKAGFTGPYNPAISAQPMSLGVSGLVREFEAPVPGAANGSSDNQVINYPAQAIAIDTMIPILATSKADDFGNTLAFSAEFTTGQGYADEFPGWTGNIAQFAGAAPYPGLNLDSGFGGVFSDGTFGLIHLQTFNLQLQYHLPKEWRSFSNIGYGQLYSNNVGDFTSSVNTGKVIYDRSDVAFINFFHDLTSQIRVAAEYDYFRTHYVDGSLAHDNRVQLSAYFLF